MQRTVEIVLKVKNAAKAKKEIQSILGDAQKKTEKYAKAGDKAAKTHTRMGGTARNAKSSITKLTSSIFSTLAAINLFNRGLQGSINLIEEFGQFERASRALETTTGRLTEILPMLRNATRNTINDTKLLTSANRAIMEGLDTNQLQKAYGLATKASRHMAISTEEGVEAVTRALTRHDERALKTLGIITRNNSAYQILMNTIGSMKGPAKAAMRIQARMAFITSQLTGKFGGLNNVQEDTLELLNQTRVSFQNLRMSMGRLVAMAFSPFMGVLRDSLTSFRGYIDKVIMSNDNMKKMIKNVAVATGVFGGLFTAIKAFGLMVSVGLMKPLMILGGIAGIGAMFGAAGQEIFDFTGMLKTAGAAFRVFFQLISNYESDTGLSRTLKKDYNELGRFKDFVVGLARSFTKARIFFVSAFQGIGVGIREALAQFPGFGQNVARLFDIFTQKTPVTKRQMAEIRSAAGEIGQSIGNAFGHAIGYVERFVGALASVDGILRSIDKSSVLSAFKYVSKGIQNVGNYGTSLALNREVMQTNADLDRLGFKIQDVHGGLLGKFSNLISNAQTVGASLVSSVIGGQDYTQTHMKNMTARQMRFNELSGVNEIDRVTMTPAIQPVGGLMDATQPQPMVHPEPVQLAPQNSMPTIEEEKTEELTRLTKRMLDEMQDGNRTREAWKNEQSQRENDKARKDEVQSLLNTNQPSYSPVGG